MTQIPPPTVYRGISTGRKHTHVYEPQSGIPIDGSDSSLREYSPFRLRLVVPSVLDRMIKFDNMRRGVAEGLINNVRGEVSGVLDTISGLMIKQSTASKLAEVANRQWNKNLRSSDWDATGDDQFITKEIADIINFPGSKYHYPAEEFVNYCGLFAASMQAEVGLNLEFANEMFSANNLLRHAEEWGRLLDGTSDIRAGDIILTGDRNGTTVGHVATVISVENGVIMTIEGNSTGQMYDGSRATGIIKRVDRGSNGTIKKVIRFQPQDYEDYVGGSSGSTGVGQIGAFLEEVSDTIAPPMQASPDPDVNVFSSAGVQYDSFDELQRQRKNSFLNILGPTSGYDRTTAEAFISAGREALSTDKASTEPGLIDRVSVVDMITQIRAVLEAPPLTLLINPSEFAINYEKLQQYTQRTREGYIFQSWGEGQPVITFSGFTGAFIAGSLGTETSSGVQFASKRNSASYQNLMNLLTIYRNNGHIFDNFSGSAAPHFVGMVAIEYDQWTYIGNFNSFSWGYDEVENQNGRISFDIEFAVSQMFDSHEPSENIMPLLKKPRRTVRYPTDPIPEGGGTSTPPKSSQTPLSSSEALAAFQEPTPTPASTPQRGLTPRAPGRGVSLEPV